MTVSVLLATTGRPDSVERIVRDLIATTKGHEVELVTAIDADGESIDRIAAMEDDFPEGFQWILSWRDEHRGSSRAWNDALAYATGDPVVLAADDLEFRHGWLDAALKTLAEFPDGWGFVGFNDGHWGAELSTHYLMSRRFIVEHLGGVIAWDCYRHSFNDREANERAKRAGRYAWCEDARVYHRHWIFGERPQDSTDTRLLGLHGESQRIFDERLAAGFPDEQEAVIECW